MLVVNVSLMVIIIKQCLCLQVALINGTETTMVYQNHTLNKQFQLNRYSYSCSNKYLYTFNYTFFQYPNNYTFMLNITDTQGIYQVSANPIQKKNQFKQSIFVLSSIIDCNGSCLINYTNYCDSSSYYGGISIYISLIPNLVITYNIICDSTQIFSPFQWGLVILIIVCVIQIIINSMFQQANSFDNKGHYINWKSILIFCIISIIGQILILIKFPCLQCEQDIINYICILSTFVIGTASIWVCTCELLYWLNISRLKSYLCTNCNCFHFNLKIRVMDIIGIAIGSGTTSAWYLVQQNWIISNFIYFTIFTFIIKIIKFGSLKIAVIMFAIVSTLNLIFIIVTYQYKDYFNNIILTIFNNPFFIMCPIINYVPNQQCSWFFIGCIAYPGIVLSYLRRFDQSRSSTVYSLTFIITFIISSIIWIVCSLFVPFTIPYGLINSPICLVMILILANRRGEIENLWSGEIYDGKHRNRKQTDQQLQEIINQSKRISYKPQWFQLRNSLNSQLSERLSASSKTGNYYQSQSGDGKHDKEDAI